MSDLAEIKQRLARLSELNSELQGHLKKLRGPEGIELRESAKKQAKKMGVGAGISAAGVFVLIGGALYINALLIILLDLVMPLWAAALIVVIGAFFLGGSMLIIGIGVSRKAAKDFPAIAGGTLQSIKETGEEMKKAVEELQTAAKREAEERKAQMLKTAESLKPVVPFIVGAFIAYKLLKRRARKSKMRRIVLEEWPED